jgi:predicted NAD/FAD-dependent oxidoreductase
MKNKDIVKEWVGNFGSLHLETSSFHADASSRPRLVGIPSQSAICRYQLDGTQVRYSTAVRAMEQHGGQWHLFGQAAGNEQPPPLGSFDALVLADRLCANRTSRLFCATDSPAQVRLATTLILIH